METKASNEIETPHTPGTPAGEDSVDCLVGHFRAIGNALAQIGEIAYVVYVILCMLPLFGATSRPNETLGDWHVRQFRKTLRERFLPNVKLTDSYRRENE